MKRIFAVIAVMAVFLMVAAPVMSAEVFAPGHASTGTIGTSGKNWSGGYFVSVNNPCIGVTSKDWGAGSVEWTLSATEKQTHFLYLSNAAAGAVIVGPSEIGRSFTLYNKSGQAITIKKSGGVGISIANGKVATVVYATNDYVRMTSDLTF